MIGIYGGTFDPAHYGHLRMALEVRETLKLDEVRFIPCQIPPHRGIPSATADQRLLMLQAALENAGPGFTIDTRELDRPGPSYMVDTLASLRADIGPAPMGLILGTDAFLGLTGWNRWESLVDFAHIVVMQRPGYRSEWPSDLAKLVRNRASTTSRLSERPAGLIRFVDVTQLDISATRIRQIIASGLSARYLTPDPVLEWIRKLDLYRSD